MMASVGGLIFTAGAAAAAVLLLAVTCDATAPPVPPLLKTWWHNRSEAQVHAPVAPNAVRRSPFFAVGVSVASPGGVDTPPPSRAFVYLSIPRSGAPKRGYTEADGAEYATSARLTMSWASFLYAADVWVYITHLGPQYHRVDLPRIFQTRPRRLAAELGTWRRVNNDTIAVRVPHRPGGFRFSVEFSDENVVTYNDGTGCCNLTDRPGPGHLPVHTQPRNALMIFAEPMITDPDERVRLDPEFDPAVNGAGVGNRSITIATPGDVRGLLRNVSTQVIYFGPGVYWMTGAFSARLRDPVRWVHLAPGAYLKGALEFGGTQQSEYKVTGFGVLSGEQVYSQNPRGRG